MRPHNILLTSVQKEWIVALTCLACVITPPVFFAYDLLSIALDHGYSPLLHTISAFAIQPFG